MIQIYAIIALALAAAFTGGGLYIKALRAENAQMTQAYKIAAQTAIDNKAALDTEIKDRARVDGILTAREQQLARIRQSNQVLNHALDALKRDNQDVRTWSDAPVPDAVIRLLDPADPPGQDRTPQAVPAPVPDAPHPQPPH